MTKAEEEVFNKQINAAIEKRTYEMSILDELLAELIVRAHIFNAYRDYIKSIQGIGDLADNWIWNRTRDIQLNSDNSTLSHLQYEAEWAADEYNKYIRIKEKKNAK